MMLFDYCWEGNGRHLQDMFSCEFVCCIAMLTSFFITVIVTRIILGSQDLVRSQGLILTKISIIGQVLIPCVCKHVLVYIQWQACCHQNCDHPSTPMPSRYLPAISIWVPLRKLWTVILQVVPLQNGPPGLSAAPYMVPPDYPWRYRRS